ncbi:response regulator [Fusibacter ferrireducens]|uniref:Stage 0 sporulation protein A homolog n=1 Tax=Fusibacter ferrireducens TaxID=2785058 RepID=A0ABR9ZXM1_9FIRM|nr:response regulator [Fusibacter ferrireducens]MBF4694696.1 response regulator [Fusibacter ferrireducens]
MSITVLLVDDEEHILEELLFILNREDDYQVIEACNTGDQALKAVQRYHPDVIILDIEMAGINGIEFAKRVLKGSYSPYIIYLTAYENYAVKAFAVGAKGYILKPFSDEEILSHLKKAKDEIMKEAIVEDRRTFIRQIKNRLIHNCLFPSKSEETDALKTQCTYIGIDLESMNVCIAVEFSRTDTFESPRVVHTFLSGVEQFLDAYSNKLIGFILKTQMLVFLTVDRQISHEEQNKRLHDICTEIFNRIQSFKLQKVYFGVSSLKFSNAGDVKKLYLEAKQASEVRRHTVEGKGIHFIDESNLELMLNSIPSDVMQTMIDNFFKNEGDLEKFKNDKVLLETIEQFLKNNLNLSETARVLYIHRNTLNYRLENILKITGRDPRILDDAMELRVLIWYIRRDDKNLFNL